MFQRNAATAVPVVVSAAWNCGPVRSADRPNVLLRFAADVPASGLRGDGNSVVRTPHVDRRHHEQPFVVDPPVRVRAIACGDDIRTPIKSVSLPEIDFRFHDQYHVKRWSWYP